MGKQLNIEEDVWDKKKVATALAIFIFALAGFIFARNYFFPKKNMPNLLTADVKGIQTQKMPAFTLPSANDVSMQLQKIQNQVTQVNVGEIASSSPQIQQIIKEIQNLPNLPKNIAKQACENLCSKL